MKELLHEIANCTICAPFLDHDPRPVLAADKESRIIIIGQAPGSKVHASGIAWDDKSGENLREWMGLDHSTFYDTKQIAIVPMGFCYPGKGKTGDLAPRKECAPKWHTLLLQEMKNVKLILLIGKYAQDQYLQQSSHQTLTDTVRNFEQFLPQYFVLPHPSPRNNIWQAKNPWFAKEVLPALKRKIESILA